MNIKNPSIVFFVCLFYTSLGMAIFECSPSSMFSLYASLFVSILSCLFYRFFIKKGTLVFIIVCFLCVFTGNLRVWLHTKQYRDNSISGMKFITVTNNPVNKIRSQSFIGKTNTHEKILVRTIGKTDFIYGDILYGSLVCAKPKNFKTDQDTIFDYVTYLKKESIYFICKPKNSLLLMKHQSTFVGSLYNFANTIARFIQDTFASPHSDFIGGVLVGDKTTIDNTIRNDFIKTGTIHIIALSGYNIAIVAFFFEKIFSWFMRKRYALILSAVSIVLFVAMTGFSSSAIRAGIMALIVVFAGLSYQKYSPLRALLFASFVMILWNPYYLFYDSSFHLSFLATYGIVVLAPILDRQLTVIHKSIKSFITTTLGAYILTFPYILYFFQGISFVGIVANIVITPWIPIFMFLGFISLISYPFTYIQTLFVFVTEKVSLGILFLIHFFSELPYSYMSLKISVWILCILYFFILCYIFYYQKFDFENKI